MLFKLILSHVIFEPRYSMIANRTIQPSCQSLKIGVRSSVPLTSSLCCCSLKIQGKSLLARFYSTNGYHEGRGIRDIGRDSLRSVDTERETLRQRLNAFARQSRKTSSIKRFEPCYRQIYPSKKRTATFKIPKKPPYIPAVNQKKTMSFRDKYKTMELVPVKGRRLQWPPLYPSKRKDHPTKQPDESHNLPQWLLPLYSCKACHTKSVPTTSEVQFSGGVFRRKMEIIESIRQIRANQDIQVKETKKGERASETVRSVNAVEALKQKIYSMQDYLSAMNNMKAYKNKYKKINATEPAENPPEGQYARIHRTKPPTQERELRVRNSMGLGVTGHTSKDKPLQDVNIVTEQRKEADNINMKMHTPVNLNEGAAQNLEVGSNSLKQPLVNTTAKVANNLSLGQIQNESLVMIKQPSWKKQEIPNIPKNNDAIPNQNKPTLNSPANYNPRRPQGEIANDVSMLNQQIKKQDSKTVEDGSKTVAWTVESLKSRINVMKIKTTVEPSLKKAEDMSLTRNGEARPKISQVALRSFHKDAGNRYTKKVQVSNATKVRLGHLTTQRRFSTFRPQTEHSKTRALGYRRTMFTRLQNKKQNWVNRLKRCLVRKKIKTKCQNWKETPREIRYENEGVKYYSPAPILWKPADLDDNLRGCSFKSAGVIFEDKVNPAVLNAERRVLASLSRLITAKPQAEAPARVNMEKRIERAKMKVNVMPWLKRSKSSDSVQKLPQLRGSDRPYEEPRESGYEWILKNRDMVEELKRQSRHAAGKSLVPPEVKNSINLYKLPLKAEISQYRKKMDNKCLDNFYVYSTSKRWYSTCYAGERRRILSCSDVILLNTRGIKTSCRENAMSSTFLGRRTRSDIVLGTNCRQYNQRAYNNNTPKGCGSKIEDYGDSKIEKRAKKWTWKIPNKTRAFTPKATNLTSPMMRETRMSEMSPCALKKQVEELKRLIKKAREETVEKTDEHPIDPQSDEYEARLKRLVKAAHNNAKKMHIVEPKFTSENNMMANKPRNGIRISSKPNQCDAESENPKSEVSVLKSLFKKTDGGCKPLADEILDRNNLTSLPASTSYKKSEKPISRVYLKLKSLVEAVRKSATLDTTNEVQLLSSKSLKGSISVNAMHPSASSVYKSGKPRDVIKCEYSDQETTPVMVELVAQRTSTPSNTIQLWKGDTKPTQFNLLNDKEPTYGDLLTLFTKAKGLFYYQLEGDKTVDKKAQISEMSEVKNKNDFNQTELKNWLSIREDVSNAARAISEVKNDPPRIETIPQAGPILGVKQNISEVDNFEYIMSKSKIIPYELLKPRTKVSCDHMWASVPVKVQEDEDLCTRSPENNATSENQLADQRKSGHQESQNPVSLEATKMLFQKPMAAWESLTKTFGSNLFGKAAEIPNNESQQAQVRNNDNVCSSQEPKTDKTQARPSEESQISHFKIYHSHNNNHIQPSQNILAENVTSKCSHDLEINKESLPHQNITSSNFFENATNKPSCKDNVQDCVEGMKPLEETLTNYENYYRNYFAEDTVSGYERLYQVYEGLNKLNTLIQYQNLDKPSKMDSEAEGASHDKLEEANTAIKTVNRTMDLESQRPTNAQSEELKMATETKHYASFDQVLAVETSEAPVSRDFTEPGSTDKTTNTIWVHEPNSSNKSGSGSETYHNVGDLVGPLNDMERIPETLQQPDKVQAHPASVNNKDGSVNFEELLTVDPTLNPEVVKKLKLPAILTEDGHIEKNWYTKLPGPNQNR